MFNRQERVHFIGIGGIGMSGIAQLLLASGLKVSGCDLKSSLLIEKLNKQGAQIFIGHSPSHLQDTDVVIYSSAIRQDNPELLAARAQGLCVLTRAEGLAVLANQKQSIAVSGAHGKTTTSSLIAHLLVNCGLRPTICVGGDLISLNGNAFSGEGHYFVLEADESDGSFLNYQPLYSVVTNIDREHLDYYRDLEHIRSSFRCFMQNTRDRGCIFFCRDDAQLTSLASSLENKRRFSFGLTTESDISAGGIRLEENRSWFNCFYRGQDLGQVTLEIPGQHNIVNSLAAIALGLEIGLDFAAVGQALSSYRGVRRRQELKLKEKEILIFEDYAHHPTEIQATVAALKNFRHQRIMAVFQPHRYTRTKFLIDEFGRCFNGVDYLIITDIYAASESPIEGVSAARICQKAKEAGIKEAHFLPKEQIVEHLSGEIRPGDLVAILGAGDIGSIADELAQRIKDQGSF